MTKRPWMPWDVPAYIADTRTFTLEQHGAYMLLLGAMWMHGGRLPDDENVLARVVGIGVKRWRKIRGPIVEKLTVENGEVTQKRLLREQEQVEKVTAKRKHAGALGGMSTALKYHKALRANGPANGAAKTQQTGQQKEGISSSKRPSISQSHIETTTESVPSSARASSSGLEGPPTRSESSEQASSPGETERMEALRQERQARFEEAMRNNHRDPATGKRLAS